MSVPTNCPECNSLQRFSVHSRRVAGKIETYTGCKMCDYELVLDVQTPQEWIQTRRDRVRLLRALRRRVR